MWVEFEPPDLCHTTQVLKIIVIYGSLFHNMDKMTMATASVPVQVKIPMKMNLDVAPNNISRNEETGRLGSSNFAEQ